MIKFQGDLSEACKNFTIKRVRKLTCIVISCIGVILAIPFIILAFIYNWAFILASLLLLAMPLFQYFSYRGSTLDLMLPTEIEICGSTILSKGRKFSEIRDLSDITKIIDYGEWYQIYFKFPYRSQNFIIEKRLLVEGSLEDFNNLFKDKIHKNS